LRKERSLFLIKTTILYGSLSTGFSLIGLFLPYATISENPLDSATVEHVFGHIIWGVIAGLASLSLRYVFLSGAFAIILDADHLVSFLGVDMVTRMDHSIPFAFVTLIVMMLVFGKKDYLLGAICFAAVFSHMSFDVFIDSSGFPILAPFSEEVVFFNQYEWIPIQLIAISAVISGKILVTKNLIERKKK